jgi:hypothetical protein
MRKFTSIFRVGFLRAGLLAIVGGTVLSISTTASATLIAAGNFIGFAPPPSALAGSAVALTLATPFVGAGPGGISGNIISNVYSNDPGNPFGLGALTFIFQVQSTGSPIDRFTSNDFTSFLTDVSYANSAGTDVAPDHVDRATATTIGWTFNNFVLTNQETSLLIVRTNATQFTTSNGSVIDGQTATGAVYGPFNSALSPEPPSRPALLCLPVLEC